MKRIDFRRMLSFIMKKAWRLYRNGVVSFSKALKLAWRIITGRLRVRVRGVACDSTQSFLKGLTIVEDDDYEVVAVRDRNNPYDRNAIALKCEVFKKYQYRLGYLSKELSSLYAPTIDEGGDVLVLGEEITGYKQNRRYLGMNIAYVLIEKEAAL